MGENVRNGHTLESALIPLVRDGHTLESMVVQTPQNNNGKQEISTQYLRGFGSVPTSTGLTPIHSL
jgi:hypothetical protein